MRAKLKTFIKLLRVGDFDALFDSIAWSVPFWLFYYNHTVLITTDQPDWKPCHEPAINIRFVVPDDIRYLEKDGFTDAKVIARLEAGDKGALIEGDNEIKSVVWASQGRKFLQLSGIDFDPGEDGLFLYGAATNPKVRNQGLFYLVSEFIWEKYKAEGVKRIWGAVNANNHLWLDKLINGMNFTRVGESFYIKLFFINMRFVRNWPLPVKKIQVFFKIPPDNLKCV